MSSYSLKIDSYLFVIVKRIVNIIITTEIQFYARHEESAGPSGIRPSVRLFVRLFVNLSVIPSCLPPIKCNILSFDRHIVISLGLSVHLRVAHTSVTSLAPWMALGQNVGLLLDFVASGASVLIKDDSIVYLSISVYAIGIAI